MNRNLRVILTRVLPAAFLCAWIFLIGSLVRAPASPDETHTIPYNSHGQRLYISVLQHHLLNYFFMPMIFLILAIGCYHYFNFKKPKMK